ncbi:hypothetical protein AM500_20285 [Bacillus sp. FJAT-18017]|uniref:DUF2268 domain-containing protein n=1 Tax=Bacillus sp. FJAT-18017 TaxID=1705566 RepID=UPI0006AEE5CD|nr:DUF2268 domain-containing putative Zn-dependent protease [Bacillus sp. FJAT-18017]ALC91865.1 hypothetical protein AM500_20285 [Bacillus sp. FJAT-18017]
MGVINTNEWLEDSGDDLSKILTKLQGYFPGVESERFYRELAYFGMVGRNNGTKWDLAKLIERKEIWEWTRELMNTYKEEWDGPDIPVFIFPIARSNSLFKRDALRKSGVAYKDKLFLFLPSDVGKKELRALFVHEYHHVCRMNRTEGEIQENSLLESMVMEGLAEYTVLTECGKEFIAEWCQKYPEKKLEFLWEEFFRNNLDVKKKEKTHNQLLFGGGRIPALAGYSIGFWLVQNYYLKRKFDVKNSLKIKKILFLNNIES